MLGRPANSEMGCKKLTLTTQVDRTCKEGFAREQDIADQLGEMCDELITDISELEPGLRDAIDKFTRMMSVTQNTSDKKRIVGAYIKYVLKEGSVFEKTRLVRNLKVSLALHDRKLVRI